MHPTWYTVAILAVALLSEAFVSFYWRRRARRAEESLLKWAKETVRRP